MKAMLTACAATICLGLTAAEVEWFDAGINSYTNFPGSGETLVVDGAGTWTNITDGVMLTNKHINLNNDATVDFELAKKRDVIATTTNTIIIVAENIPLAGELPDIEDGVKGGIIAVGENDPAYYGITKDGGTNVWVKLTGTGATPTESGKATFKIDYWRDGEIVKVRYWVGNTVLTNGVAEWMEVDGDQINKVSFNGNGEIAELKGNVNISFGESDRVVAALISTNKVYGTWLLKMVADEKENVRTVLATNPILEEKLKACLLANVVPTEDNIEKEIKLETPSITFENGEIVIGSSELKVGVDPQGTNTINGTIRIYRATSIAELSTAQGESLGHTVPVPQQNLQPSDKANAEFFQLRIEP